MQIPANLAQSETTAEFTAKLTSPEGARFIASIVSAHPHTNWPFDPYRSTDHATANRIAEAILSSKRETTPSSPIDQLLPPTEPQETWYHEALPELRADLEALPDHLDKDEVADALFDHWAEAVTATDASSPADTVSSYDTCELLFTFTQSLSFEDHLIESHKAWSDPEELAITTDLQFALSQIGYTVSQFRKNTKNSHPAWQRLKPMRARRAPLVAPDKLNQAIENACSRTFIFALYAIVPLQDVFELDLAAPIIFSKCWLSVLDPINGTFHDEPIEGTVLVMPSDGHLISGSSLAWSPDDICGLHRTHYEARINNNPKPN